MAKDFKTDATAGAHDIYAQLARGAKDTKATKDVQNVQPKADKVPMERLNLKIPTELKEYLRAAAYRESSAKHTVSLTEYLCNLVRADMEKHQDD